METTDCTVPSTERPRIPRRWERAFLTALAATGNVSAACRIVRITRRNVYYARANWPDFQEAYEEACEEAAGRLEEEALRRAYYGVDKPVIYQGKLMGTWMRDGETVAEGTPGAQLVPLTIKE